MVIPVGVFATAFLSGGAKSPLSIFPPPFSLYPCPLPHHIPQLCHPTVPVLSSSCSSSPPWSILVAASIRPSITLSNAAARNSSVLGPKPDAGEDGKGSGFALTGSGCPAALWQMAVVWWPARPRSGFIPHVCGASVSLWRSVLSV